METLDNAITAVRSCTVCEGSLPFGSRPILRVCQTSRILIASQAPGIRAHNSGIPFDDASGARLREWLNVSRDEFYNISNFAILPLGLCYPGKRVGGDAPPRRECAPLWRDRLLRQATGIRLTLLIGGYAQAYAFGAGNMTERVSKFRDHMPEVIPLPHPSWRSTGWMRRNPWFQAELLPILRAKVREILS